MKKNLLGLTVVLFLSASVNAQFKQGDVLLGGNLSYSSSSYDDATNPFPGPQNEMGFFSLSAGTALRENAVVGLTVSYIPTSNNGSGPSGNVLKYVNHGFSAGVFYRLYKPLGKEFYLFGEANASYNWSDYYQEEVSGNKSLSGNSSGAMVNLFPGLAYRVSKKFFLEITIPNLFSMNYISYKSTSGGVEAAQKQFNIGANLSSNALSNLGVGFKLVL